MRFLSDDARLLMKKFMVLAVMSIIFAGTIAFVASIPFKDACVATLLGWVMYPLFPTGK